jgi:hypothetical protein
VSQNRTKGNHPDTMEKLMSAIRALSSKGDWSACPLW